MPGIEGGMGSTATGSETPRTTGGSMGCNRRYSPEPEELQQDFRGMVWRLRHSPLRRATPKWAAPRELWRQVVGPTCDNTPKKHGVGYTDRRLAPFFQSRLWQGICRIRRAGWVPMWWHRSITFPIDKNNNKEGCNAVRLVNAFSRDSKAFYGYLWRRQPQTQQRSYASGCTEHRSRLEAIAQSVNIAARLRRAKISFVTTNYNVANAHPSPSHTSLSEALDDTRHEDTGLLKQRHELATMEIQGADESILKRPGSGTTQGSEGAADAFHRVYHKRIDKWADHLQAGSMQEALIFKAPPASSDLFEPSVFMGLTTYADDVRVTSITTEPGHTWERVVANNTALDNALDEMAQNTAKQEHSVFFAGQRARQYMAALNGKGVLPGTTGPVARYLGPHLDIMGSSRPELERRRAAAFRTWNRFRPVWFRAGIPLRVRRLFFRALVVSILKTGLEALRLTPPDYEYLDRFILGLGRKMMRGKATIVSKMEDGTEKKRTVDRRKVWEFLGLVPSATELHARRLQWYQNLMRDPTAHQNVLFSFFGEASFEVNTVSDEGGRIRESSCGGARHWQEDVDGLEAFDDGAFVMERGGRAVGQWFLDCKLKQDFFLLDMNGIRAAYRAVRIPPPGCLGGSLAVISHETEKQEEVVTEQPFVCTTCNDSFETLRQLVTHQTHKHGYRNPPGIVTVTNTSVWSQNIYKDRRATYLHQQQSWKREYCTGKGSHLHTLVIPVKTSCPHCDQHFESVAMLLEHLRTVFPLVSYAELDPVKVVGNDGSGAQMLLILFRLALMTTAGTKDPEDQQTVTAYMSSVNSQETLVPSVGVHFPPLFLKPVGLGG